MNVKILALLREKLEEAFNLPKYKDLVISEHVLVEELPWTPARFRKFKESVENELYLECDFRGKLGDIVEDLDRRYLSKFFGEIWRPRTDEYSYTGWDLADEINKQDPKNVLDVGCGYHPFKGRIPNLIGIDPYNDAADYMVDILEYKVPLGTHDHIIALGSINFNSRAEIEARFKHCVDLLAPGGRFYLRVNPGIPHKAGPYVDIFPWSFELIKQFEIEYELKLEQFKKDSNQRLYFVYRKPGQ